MPELPEVENVARVLRATLLGRRLDGIRVRFAGALKPSPRVVRRALQGSRLVGVRRHGKYLLLDFARELDAGEALAGGSAAVVAEPAAAYGPGPPPGAENVLLLHLRMTGQVFVDPGYRPDKHLRLVFDFEGLPVHYRDLRKFGGFTLLAPGEEASALARVGPDMLAISFAEWERRLAGRRAPLKSLLLDQRIAAGLGNIYADEALHRAGVNPLAAPRDLEGDTLRRVWREARRVLRLGIRHGGTTFLDFVDFTGKPGRFRRKLRVYGRGGEPCATCGTAIEKRKVGGRGTHYCPRCQPPPRWARFSRARS